MDSLRINCPSCDRMLELPAYAAGRMAKCPACQATFTVDADGSSRTTPNDPKMSDPATSDPVPVDQPFAPSTDESRVQSEEAAVGDDLDSGETFPSRSENPFSTPLASSVDRPTWSGSAGTANPAPLNPYQASAETAPPVGQIGPLTIVPRSIDDIISPSFSIFGQRWGSLVGAFLITFVASLVMWGLSAATTQILGQTINRDVAALFNIVASIGTSIVSAYLNLGVARNALAVARDEPSPLKQLLPPADVFLRFLGGAAVIGLALLAAMLLVGGLFVILSMVGIDQDILAIVAILTFLVLLPLFFVGWWMFWSWLMIAADGKLGVIDSLRAAHMVTMHNKLTSLLVLVITAALAVAGLLACYVGQIVTGPLTMLIFAVGYLSMTRQPISVPLKPGYSGTQFPPPPQKPTF